MLLARITFTVTAIEVDRDAAKDVAESYLAALLKNGQICGDYFVAWANGKLTAYTHVAGTDALEDQFHSDWSTRDLDTVIDSFGGRPDVEIIDDALPESVPTWQSSSFLYLFTHAFDDGSPILCGDSGQPIPLYSVPITQNRREAVYFWSRSYNYHDNIWIGSGALEMSAYSQLADPESELSRTGRDLCANIEDATSTPTFYYMQRYWGYTDGESTRPCPLCGADWQNSDRVQRHHPFHHFNFKCEPCRLVSHTGDSYDEPQKATIGAYKG